jgi:hypothetical protein
VYLSPQLLLRAVQGAAVIHTRSTRDEHFTAGKMEPYFDGLAGTIGIEHNGRLHRARR